MTKRVAIYARYSSGLQKQTSIEDQIAHAERFAESRGWTVTHRFTDYEKSGRTTRREGFQALRRAVNARLVDVVVVEAVDRLTRRIKDAMSEFELMEFSQVELHSVNEGPQNFITVLIHGLGAQLYAKSVGEHTRRGMIQSLSRLRLHTSAYGYRSLDNEQGLNREIDPDEAEIVRRIFREFAEGHSTHSIIRRLNADGIPSPRGTTWDTSTLRGNPARFEGMLRNRLYIGVASIGKTARRYHPETNRREIQATPDSANEVEIPSLRIIDQDLWDRVEAQLIAQAAKVKRKGNPVGARRSKFLLSGLLKCGCCGAPYVKSSQTHFGCREGRKGACANKKTIRQDVIEARIFNKLRGQFLTPELAATFDAALKTEYKSLASSDQTEAKKRLESRLAEAVKGRKNLYKAIESGANFASLLERISEVEAEIKAFEAKLEQYRQTEAVLPKLPTDSTELFAQAIERLESLLGDPDLVHQANEHMTELIQYIVLRPDFTAPNGIAAEITLDLGSLLSAASVDPAIADIFTDSAKLSVRQGALPLWPAAIHPEVFLSE